MGYVVEPGLEVRAPGPKSCSSLVTPFGAAPGLLSSCGPVKPLGAPLRVACAQECGGLTLRWGASALWSLAPLPRWGRGSVGKRTSLQPSNGMISIISQGPQPGGAPVPAEGLGR